MNNIRSRALWIMAVLLQALNRLKPNIFNGRELAERHWDNPISWYMPGGFKVYWETLPIVARYQYECMTGDAEKDYITYIIEYTRENIVSGAALFGATLA